MASLSFILKEPNSKESTLIYLVVRHDNQRIKLSTGVKIEPRKWDSSKQRINRKATIGEQAANSTLNRLRDSLDSYTAQVRLEGSQFSLTSFKAYLDSLNKPLKKVDKNLLNFIDSFIKEVNRRPDTIKGYRNTLNRLNEYAEANKQQINFEDVDLSLLNNLISYFEEVKMYAMNTIQLHVKNLKVFMREAKERGLHDCSAYESKRFTAPTENTPKIYLTLQELDQIRKVDLSQNKRLERIRDLFLIQAHTGVRDSDSHKINEDNLKHEDGSSFFQIRNEKTAGFLWIPILDDEVLSILKKYRGQSPSLGSRNRPISNQKYNEYLKEIGKAAQLFETFTTYRTEGGKRIERKQYKAELLCTHTARRSFATNAYKAGLPAPSIMAITGHKTESSFRKYIQLSSKEHALELIRRSNSKMKESSLAMRRV